MSKKQMFLRIVDSPGGPGPTLPLDDTVEDIREQILAELDGTTPGDNEELIFKIRPVWMTPEEYEALPEFEGY